MLPPWSWERESHFLFFPISFSFFPSYLPFYSLLTSFFSWNRLNLSHRIWFKLWFWFWVWLWFWFWIRIRMRQLSNNQRDRLPGWELELIIVWLWLPVSVLREREGVQHLHDGLHSSRRDPMVCHQGNFYLLIRRFSKIVCLCTCRGILFLLIFSVHQIEKRVATNQGYFFKIFSI